jgi:hypothetical protein
LEIGIKAVSNTVTNTISKDRISGLPLTNLTDAAAKGLTFISDTAIPGLHPNAHLWDTGTDAVSETQIE